jgi:hypothetical protein
MPGTVVNFTMNGFHLPPPVLDVPYFPLVGSSHASYLFSISRNKSKDNEESSSSVGSDREPLIVHELCALQMFRARMDRHKHSQRRRRRLVADTAAALAGVSVRSLGTDSRNVEYWKFPGSDALFICIGASSQPNIGDKLELLRMIGRAAEDPRDAKGTSNPYTWRVVSDRSDIQVLLALLGQGEKESELRRQLGILFLPPIDGSDDRGQIEPEDSDADSSADSEPEDEGGEVGDGGDGGDGEADAVSVANSVNAPTIGSTSSGRIRQSSRKISAAPTATLTPAEAEKLPTALKLLTDKGVNIPEKVVIQQESAFSDSEDEEENDDDDDREVFVHKDYFHFGKKYYAVALVNNMDKRVRPAKDAFTVLYQITLSSGPEKSNCLARTPLSEAWSDGLFYFSSVVFRKSGVYTISFEAAAASSLKDSSKSKQPIRPLMFTVVVEAKSISCGPSHAVQSLRANSFAFAANRLFVQSRQELSTTNHNVELVSVKQCLLNIYAALPIGSLTLSDASGGNTSSNGARSITDVSTGWSNVLDVLWRQAVISAASPVELMECVLLLENHINSAWVAGHNAKMLAALPAPHFAMRCCTVASVALRVFCLDACLLYEKVELPARDRRRSASSYVSTVEVKPQSRPPAPAPSASSYSSRRRRVIEDDDDSPENASPAAVTGAGSDNGQTEESFEASNEDSEEVSDEDLAASYRKNKRTRGTQQRGRPIKRSKSDSNSDEPDSDDDEEEDENFDAAEKGDNSDDEDDEDDDDSSGDNRRRRNASNRRSGTGSRSRRSSDASSGRGSRPLRKSSRQRSEVHYFENDDSDVEAENFDVSDPESDRGRRSRRPLSSSGGTHSGGGPSFEDDTEEEMEPTDSNAGSVIDIYEELRNLQQLVDSDGQDSVDSSTDSKIRYFAILKHYRSDPNSEIFWTPVDCRVVKDYK